MGRGGTGYKATTNSVTRLFSLVVCIITGSQIKAITGKALLDYEHLMSTRNPGTWHLLWPTTSLDKQPDNIGAQITARENNSCLPPTGRRKIFLLFHADFRTIREHPWAADLDKAWNYDFVRFPREDRHLLQRPVLRLDIVQPCDAGSPMAASLDHSTRHQRIKNINSDSPRNLQSSLESRRWSSYAGRPLTFV